MVIPSLKRHVLALYVFKRFNGNILSAYGDVVTREYLMHGTRRELQKMGRLVGEKALGLGDELHVR